MKQAYILYANEAYAETVEACVKSLNYYSNIGVIVYMINSDYQIEGANTVRWNCDVAEIKQSKYIDRTNLDTYKLLLQRPLVVKHALENFADIVCYVDSDSVATKYVDSIFDMYDNEANHPYFVEGIYEYLHVGNRGGAESRDDLSTTLEAPACELFGVNQYVRDKYRQTGYFVANKKSIPFLEEWYQMCVHPEVLANNAYYAAYNEETILNVLLYKYNIQVGLPYIYVNGGKDNYKFIGQDYIAKEWLRIPAYKERLLFYHGEKNKEKMLSMIQKPKILFIAPHLSTGGMPAFLLKSIQTLYKSFEIEVVEYQCHSLDFIVQRDAIKELVPMTTLYENKMELFDVISRFGPDIIHIHEPSERLNREMISELYKEDRLYRIIETCHDVSFNHDKEKILHPDAYYFCTPYHLKTFASSPSYKEVIEFPIDDRTQEVYDNFFDTSKINIVNVGLWTPGKNQAEGIEIARKYPDMDFHFIGNQAGNFKDYWEPLMKDLPSNVKVWGERNDAHRFISLADIFMFNSTWECNPLVLREAISFGKPIIAHNLPQYGSMFDKYIQPINTDLNTIIRNYIVPTDNTTDIFTNKQIAFYNKVLSIEKQEQDIDIIQHFVNQPYLEIKSGLNAKFKVQYFDGDKLVYDNTIGSNCWIKLNRHYYTKWESKVFMNNELIHHNILNLEGKRVYISLASKSLGDTIAWVPYAYEFQKKHNCKVILSSFWNKILDMPEIELVEPGSVVPNIYAQYNLGWFYDSNKEPALPNTIKLQQAATNILGLDFQDIKPKLKYDAGNNKYGKYVTIATNSTAGCKFWTREAWQEIINYLSYKGYRVINVSKEDNPFDNCDKIDDISIENTMSVIHHSEFFIGLSSGLSWLAWALGKQVVMISNFTVEDHEFDCIRITNKSVCHGCWNNPNFKFDAGDWNWCPIWKNTDKHFECQKSILVIDVIYELENRGLIG